MERPTGLCFYPGGDYSVALFALSQSSRLGWHPGSCDAQIQALVGGRGTLRPAAQGLAPTAHRPQASYHTAGEARATAGILGRKSTEEQLLLCCPPGDTGLVLQPPGCWV